MIERRLVDPALASELEDGLRAARPRPDAPVADLHGLLRWLHEPAGPLERATGPGGGAEATARAIATLATVDMTVAFSVWAHTMVLVYLREADSPSSFAAWTKHLEGAHLAGATALAAAMTCHVSGAPLPIKAVSVDGHLEVSGRIAWASNLYRPHFVLVTAAEVEGLGPRVVAMRGKDSAIEIAPFPNLVDLQATASSSIQLNAARVHPDDIVAADFSAFIHRVRPRFLLFQASFCWGLAARALREAAAYIGPGVSEVFTPDHHELSTELDRIEGAIVDGVGSGPPERRARPIRELVQLRLDAARLAGAATRLEANLAGGRGYVVHSATARRLREAAFLPIQSPTEGQLRWELSRSS
jgi:alkylation response protein AidB-like acyl-CoA dehydrogenase